MNEKFEKKKPSKREAVKATITKSRNSIPGQRLIAIWSGNQRLQRGGFVPFNYSFPPPFFSFTNSFFKCHKRLCTAVKRRVNDFPSSAAKIKN
jgi:hypothetical protein